MQAGIVRDSRLALLIRIFSFEVRVQFFVGDRERRSLNLESLLYCPAGWDPVEAERGVVLNK